jgi:alpha-galactosidase
MYIMEIIGGRHLGHIYYGKKKRGFDPDFHYRTGSFTPYFEDLYQFQPDLARTEYSYFGGGDFRCTSLKIKKYSRAIRQDSGGLQLWVSRF